MHTSRQWLWITASILLLCPALALAQDRWHIVGQVMDDRGRPVEDAVVVLYHEPSDTPALGARPFKKLAETRTSADGQYVLDSELEWHGIPLLFAYKAGCAMSWADPKAYAILQLGKPQTLAGVVVDANDHPIVGARVSLCAKNEFMIPRQLAVLVPNPWGVTQTDENGRFVLDGIPSETTADFWVEVPDRVPYWTSCDSGLDEGERYTAGETDIRIKVPTRSRIEGRVVDEDTAQPVPHLRVWVQPGEQPYPWGWSDVASTDAEGRFTIAGLASGPYQVRVSSAEGQEPFWFGPAAVHVQAGQTLNDLRLAVSKGATLEVRITDADEIPIQGVQTIVSCAPFRRTVPTDAQGFARFRVPAGTYVLSGFKPAFGGIWRPMDVQLDKARTDKREVRIERSFVTATGSMAASDGTPVTEAMVGLWPLQNASLTDANGQFRCTFYANPLPLKRNLLARDPSLGLACLGSVEDPNRSGKLAGQLILTPGHTLIGRVTDPNGTTVPYALITLFSAEAGRTIARCAWLWTCVADANGAYVIRGIPPADPDRSYVVVAHAPGFNENSIAPVPIDGPLEQPIRLKPIVLEPTIRTVCGIVLDSNDRPVPGAVVETPLSYAEDFRQPRRRVLTDAQGRFRISRICTGPVELTASTQDRRHGSTQAAGGETNVRIVLGQTLSFARDLNGTPLPCLNELGLSSGLDSKAVLLCLVDVEQRPCRHVLSVFAPRVEELLQRGVAIRAVQFTTGTPDNVQSKAKDYQAALPLAAVAGDIEKVRRTLGVQSLPWLILVDAQRTILGEGFALSDLDIVLKALDRK